MTVRRILLALFLLLPVRAFAQFYLPGDEPRGRWEQIETPGYRIVYPEVLPPEEVLKYAQALEKYNPVAGLSAGMTPGQYHWGKMPVILHAYTPLSNGSVAWAPRRMDLYTTPEAYSPLALPWVDQLVIHEQRHVAQMQFGYRSYLRPLNYIVGEMWNGAAAGLFADKSFLEGDAVVAETALTNSGRGRCADFMNYYRVAFDNGDWRNWDRWRYGSYKYPSPDHYALGYMTISGMRCFYGIPDFTARYYDGLLRNPFPLGKLGRTSKKLTGLKLKDSMRRIMEENQKIWEAEDSQNGPYANAIQVSAQPRLATDYGSLIYAGGVLYAIKSGKAQAAELISLSPDGKERVIRPFASNCSSLYYDQVKGRLYWSETVADARWDLSGESIIRYLNLEKPSRLYDLVTGGRYFSPCPSPDGSLLSATLYPVSGGSFLAVIDADEGSVLWKSPCPFQLTETTWFDGSIYALGVDEGGIGLWRHPADGPGEWIQVLAPLPCQADNLGASESALQFESDRSGLRQLYSYDPSSGVLLQESNIKYGGTDFVEVGDSVYFVSQAPMGKMVFRTGGQWYGRSVNYEDIHKWVVADTLSAQEAVFIENARPERAGDEVSSPKKYGTLGHLVRFHSWAPIYFDYDEIQSMSGDFSYSMASPGITGLFQNDLGSLYGYVGYSAHPDTAPESSKWRHAAHLKLTYSGLYPVFEAGVSFNESNANQYRYHLVSGDGAGYMATAPSVLDKPLLSGWISARLPLSRTRGGVTQGVVPQITYGISNSRFNTGAVEAELPPGTGVSPLFTGVRPGKNIFMQSLTMAARAYSVRGRGSSQVYPRYGAGAELGYSLRPGLERIFAPSAYGYLYGYLPGFTRVQGLKLNVLSQYIFRGREMFPESRVNCAPRGFDAGVGPYYAQRGNFHIRGGLDYAIPVYVGDLCIPGSILYIKNFVVTPHADAALLGPQMLASAGVDISANVPCALGVPFGFTIGVGLDYPFTGAIPEELRGKHAVSARFIFSMDI